MAEKEAKIITPEGSPTNSEDAAKLATDPTDIFNDLDKLRLELKITVERRKAMSSCRCSKPDPNLYFRSCPDVNMRLTASLIRHKQERDLFFLRCSGNAIAPAYRASASLLHAGADPDLADR